MVGCFRSPWSRFTACGVVRESNPRQPDSSSGALSTELTSLDTIFCTNHWRNTRRRPPEIRTGQRAPLEKAASMLTKRRRWESNPLKNRFAGGCRAVWLQRHKSPAVSEGDAISFSKSNGFGSRHQKQPDCRQHFLNRLPLPHGHRSLRPNFPQAAYRHARPAVLA